MDDIIINVYKANIDNIVIDTYKLNQAELCAGHT